MKNRVHNFFSIEVDSHTNDQRQAHGKKLNHNNIVKYCDYFESNKSMYYDFVNRQYTNLTKGYLVMEYCDAGDLKSYIKNKTLNIEEIDRQTTNR